ncbi:unnamed protein product, partial [Didymodactylos carnosus]
ITDAVYAILKARRAPKTLVDLQYFEHLCILCKNLPLIEYLNVNIWYKRSTRDQYKYETIKSKQLLKKLKTFYLTVKHGINFNYIKLLLSHFYFNIVIAGQYLEKNLLTKLLKTKCPMIFLHYRTNMININSELMDSIECVHFYDKPLLSLHLFKLIQQMFQNVDKLRFSIPLNIDKNMLNDKNIKLNTIVSLQLLFFHHDYDTKYPVIKPIFQLTPNINELEISFHLLFVIKDQLHSDQDLYVICQQIRHLIISSYNDSRDLDNSFDVEIQAIF